MSKPLPPISASTKTMFQNLGKAAAAARASDVPQTGTIVEHMRPIPVHNSGAGRPNFPPGGGV